MKKISLFLMFAASIMMSGCLKEKVIIKETTFVGCVKNKSNQPVCNIKVGIWANCGDWIASTYTDNYGDFSFKLNSNDMYPKDPENYYSYYLRVGDYIITSLCGLGEELYDYGTIIY